MDTEKNEKKEENNPQGELPDITRIEVDRTLCIGSATCVALTQEAFALDNENKAVVQPNWQKVDKATLWEAAKSCPVLAIKLFGKDDKQIYP